MKSYGLSSQFRAGVRVRRVSPPRPARQHQHGRCGEAREPSSPGVGPALAEAIVADRQANGNFATPEALMRVKGIGARIVEINKANILVADPAPPAR